MGRVWTFILPRNSAERGKSSGVPFFLALALCLAAPASAQRFGGESFTLGNGMQPCRMG